MLTDSLHLTGLTSDDQNLHSDRIKLWNDFNHAWLATFQAQKELMESGRPLGRGQTLITLDGLKKLGDELVRLCDSIERHGLVDYQYGVWEEQITESRLTTPVELRISPPADSGLEQSCSSATISTRPTMRQERRPRRAPVDKSANVHIPLHV